jgi:serine/threonine protein kinase
MSSDTDDIESARVRARVKQALFGGDADPVRVERFEIVGRLGAGAMGIVYEARDTELDRAVALKLLHPGLRDERTSELLLQEARGMARVRHPNVLTVHHVGMFRGQVYVAMERAKATLREWLERDQPRPDRILDVMIQAGRGLAEVHRQGLVHRDFKLDNVLIDDAGVPRVSDFGLVLRTGSGAGEGVLPARAAVGTPAYMAPEQLRGEGADAKSDQWAFAVTMIEALTGQRPFSGTSESELLASMLARPSDASLSKVPPRVAEVLRRALDPEPSLRFASLDVLVERLEAASVKPSRGRWIALLGAAALACVSLAAFALRSPASSAGPSASAAPSATVRTPVTGNITRLCMKSVRASSAAKDHPAAHAFDGIVATAWTDGVKGDGSGEWIELELEPESYVSEVEVSGGWAHQTESRVDLWTHNATFRRMQVAWDSGEAEVAFDRKKDRGKKKRVKVDKRVTRLRFTALEVDRGRFADLCLDEVAVFGECGK